MVHRGGGGGGGGGGFKLTIIRILIMDGMTINHIVSIDHGSCVVCEKQAWL